MLFRGSMFVLLSVTLWAGLCVGCTAENRSPEPMPEASVQENSTPTPAPDADPARRPSRVALFGDRPDQEKVPFENRLITNLCQHSFTIEGLDFDPDIFSAENVLVFASTRNAERPDVYLKRTDGTTLTQLTSDPADDIQPRFSPDGERVVFCSNRGGNWDIWSVRRHGTELTQLTNDPADEVAPSWSPDGSTVAYTVWGRRSHQWEIWTLSLEHPGARRFLAYGMFPAWSPDGKRIAFQRSRERGSRLFSVWTLDLEDGEARRPTEIAHNDAAACIAPAWSPDGSMIVYCTVQRETHEAETDAKTPRHADLWVVELNSGLRVKLTDGSGAAFNPVWASDGRIFFVSPRSGTENIWSLAATVGQYPDDRSQATRVSQAKTNVSVVSEED